LPVDPAVTTALEQMRPVFAELGCEVVEAEPELAAAGEVSMFCVRSALCGDTGRRCARTGRW
jgi:hypothetical protein